MRVGSRCAMRTAYSVPWRWIAALPFLAIGACSTVDPAATEQFTRTGELIALSGGDAGAANACFACHGLDGRGNGAGTPRLAGLDLGYLTAQLEGYSSGRRQHPEMQWIARRLTPADRQLVSAYYAAMPFEPAAAPRSRGGGIGETLYQAGAPDRGIQPCAACHGRWGEGGGPGNPALGGQPAAYLAEQLDLWRSSARRNDPANVMQQISLRLSKDESAALADYASRLAGGLPRQGSPEASR